MTDLIKRLERVEQALEIGLDSKRCEAKDYHDRMAGYRQHVHEQEDAEVAQLEAALEECARKGEDK